MGYANGKNSWALLLFILSGIVLGGFIGYLTRDIPVLSWLNYGQEFGIGSSTDSDMMRLNLGILTIHFGISIKITVAGIIGMVLSILLYRKL